MKVGALIIITPRQILIGVPSGKSGLLDATLLDPQTSPEFRHSLHHKNTVGVLIIHLLTNIRP